MPKNNTNDNVEISSENGLQLLVPTVQFGNVTLISKNTLTRVVDSSKEEESTDEMNEITIQRSMASLLRMKHELDKLTRSTFKLSEEPIKVLASVEKEDDEQKSEE